MKKGWYWCSGWLLDAKGGSLCMEQHFHSAGRSFQGYNDLIDTPVTLLFCYRERKRERCILSDVQNASLLKGRKPLGDQTLIQNNLVSSSTELFVSSLAWLDPMNMEVWTPTLPSVKHISHSSGPLRIGYRQITLILFWEYLEGEALLLFAPCCPFFKALT